MKRLILVVAVVLLVAGTLPAFGQDGYTFRVRVSAAQQVPNPVDSGGSGGATFRFNRDLSRALYELNAFNTTSPVVQAHIHCGEAGANGPVVAFLFNDVVQPDGNLSAGTLTDASILDKTADECGVPINNIASLFNAMRLGLTYVNLHTLNHLAGELRGQVFDIN